MEVGGERGRDGERGREGEIEVWKEGEMEGMERWMGRREKEGWKDGWVVRREEREGEEDGARKEIWRDEEEKE